MTALQDYHLFIYNVHNKISSIVFIQVRLPCNVTVLPDSVLVWKQGSRVIFAGGLRVRRDQRFQLGKRE